MFNESIKRLERIQEQRMKNIVDAVCDGDRDCYNFQPPIEIRGLYTIEDMQKAHEEGEL
ncbi:hypothetical protein ACQKIY_25345 [Bacillus mycoides]|uniref:hypothetical protein n=1 Tax=Bacillus mycoides TaxID=1405 RepID=UPI003D04E98E